VPQINWVSLSDWEYQQNARNRTHDVKIAVVSSTAQSKISLREGLHRRLSL
jgi:hypothetical protein